MNTFFVIKDNARNTQEIHISTRTLDSLLAYARSAALRDNAPEFAALVKDITVAAIPEYAAAMAVLEAEGGTVG